MRMRKICLLIKTIIVISCIAIYIIFGCTIASAWSNKALIVFDNSSDYTNEPDCNINTLKNLMGHFNLSTDAKSIDNYQEGEIEDYRSLIYLGTDDSKQLSDVFLRDVINTKRQIIWLGINFDKLADNPTYKEAFKQKFGFAYVSSLNNNGFTTTYFRGKSFDRIQQQRIEKTRITNNDYAKVLAEATNGTITIPYVVKSKNFNYIADNPLGLYWSSQVYTVFCEILHKQLRINHQMNNRALVRIEDVSPDSNPQKLIEIADYLYSQNIPFSVSVIPRFTDPLGSWGPPITVDLNEKPEVVNALNYMKSKGGTLLMHGFTHQYDSVVNPTNGVTGVDSEFYIQKIEDGQIINVSPVPEDSPEWVQNRVNNSAQLFNDAGLNKPNIWVTPHYVASNLDYSVLSNDFPAFYQRFTDTFFPFVVYESAYNNKILPENLGYISPGYIEPQNLIYDAQYYLTIRDGFASFFFHLTSSLGCMFEKTTLTAGIEAPRTIRNEKITKMNKDINGKTRIKN